MDASNIKDIFCCGCNKIVQATSVGGDAIYPHRPDLYDLTFFRCPTCGCYVGTHKVGRNQGKPLGSMPTAEIRRWRNTLHREYIDPLWQSGRFKRGKLYAMIAQHLGIKAYHTGEINDIERVKTIMNYLKTI